MCVGSNVISLCSLEKYFQEIWYDLIYVIVKQAEAKQVFISQTIFKALIILTLVYETFGSASKILFEKKIG